MATGDPLLEGKEADGSALTGLGNLDWYSANDYTGSDAEKIQAAVDAAQTAGGGVVFIPTGNWNVDETITVTGASLGAGNYGYIHVIGDGVGATSLIRSGNYGDTFVFKAPGTSTQLFGCSISNLLMVKTTGSMTSTQAHLSVYYTYNFRGENLWLKNGGIGLQIFGQTHATFFSKCNIDLMAGYTGQAGIVMALGSYGHGLPYLSLTDCDLYPSTTSNSWTYGIFVKAGDGLWANNVHVGRATFAAVGIIPSANTTQVTGLKFVNCWFDNEGSSAQSYSIYIEGTNNTAAPFGIMNFTGCHFQGYGTEYGFLIASGNVENVILDGCNFYDYKRGAIYLGGGNKLVVSNNRVVGGSSDGVGSYNGLSVAGATRFVISGNSIGYQRMLTTDANNAYGIYIVGACVDYIVTSNNCYGNTTGGISDGGTATGGKVVANNLP